MHPFSENFSFVPPDRAALPRWACVVALLHAVAAALGLTLHLL